MLGCGGLFKYREEMKRLGTVICDIPVFYHLRKFKFQMFQKDLEFRGKKFLRKRFRSLVYCTFWSYTLN